MNRSTNRGLGARVRAADLPVRRRLVAEARRVLWSLSRRSSDRQAQARLDARGWLRRRLGEFLRRSTARRLAEILRSAVLAGAIAASLAAAGPLPAAEIPLVPVKLEDVAVGQGGFLARGEAEPASGAGRSVSGAGDVNGDGIPDLVIGGKFCSSVGDCTSAPAYVVFGKRDAATVELSELIAGRGGFAIRAAAETDRAGWSLSGAGDVNGDGLADVIIGAYYASPEGRYLAGESYVVFGKRDSATVKLSEVRAGQGGFAIRGAEPDDLSGFSVSGGGDVNGDGLPDLIIGASQASPGGRYQAGETYVVFGKRDGAAVELSEVKAGRGGFAIRGEVVGGASGQSVSGAGDVNGDGLADLILSVPGASNGGDFDAPGSFVVFGKRDTGVVDLKDLKAGGGGFAILGTDLMRQPLSSVSGAGDVNGDRLSDLIIGSFLASPGGRYGAGETFVVFGKVDGTAVKLPDVRAGRGGFTILGNQENERSGQSVSGAGDVNGDDLADLLIGAPGAGNAADGKLLAGVSYVVFGKANGKAVELSGVLKGEEGFAVRGTTQYDRIGNSVSGGGDLNGDGLDDLVVGAAETAPEGRAEAGEVYVVFGKAAGGSIEVPAIRGGQGGFAIRGMAQDSFYGLNVSDAGDVNGDGLADIIIGSPYAGPKGRYQAGESYVVFGKRGGGGIDLAEVREGRGGFAIRGAVERGLSGSSVSGAGDLNGDRLADLVIGAPEAGLAFRPYSGQVYVVFGKADGRTVELSDVILGGDGFTIYGRTPSSHAGQSVSGAGDVNGDGTPDLLIGAPSAPGVGNRYQAGECYVVFGKADGGAVDLDNLAASRAGITIRGAAESDHAGSSVSGAGDVNGDGLADLIVGAPFATPENKSSGYSGESYVVFGIREAATVLLTDVRAGQGGFALRGVEDGAQTGWSVSGAGDVNGDGLADVLVGAPYASPQDRYFAGETYVVFGKRDGKAVELSALQSSRGGFAIRGVAEYDYSGWSVSGVGDVDGDGLADFLIGAPYVSLRGKDYAGMSYVVLGKAAGAPVELSKIEDSVGGFPIHGRSAYDYSGRSVSGAGDVNGDGFPDLVIASGLAESRYPSLGSENSGAAYVIFGPGGSSPKALFRRGAAGGEATLGLTAVFNLLDYLFLTGALPPCLDAADVDDSGVLELTDAVSLLGYLFLSGDAPPDPGPSTCGEDPTPDLLDCKAPTQGCP